MLGAREQAFMDLHTQHSAPRGHVPGPNTAERAAVADLLVQLRERDHGILMLSYWEELTTAELAQALGCSSSAAAVRLHRARRAFGKAAPAHLMT